VNALPLLVGLLLAGPLLRVFMIDSAYLLLLAMGLSQAEPDSAARLSTVEPPPRTTESYAVEAATSASGDWFVVGWSDGRLAILDGATGRTTRALEPPLSSVPWELAISHDGRRIAALDEDARLWIWAGSEAGGFLCIQRTQAVVLRQVHGYRFGAELAWSPRGDRLALSTQEGDVSLWTAEGVPLRTWRPAGRRWTTPFAWSPDGEQLLFAAGDRIRTRAAEDGAPVPGVPDLVCGSLISSFDIRPDGETVVTGHRTCYARVWRLADGARRAEFYCPDPIIFVEDDDLGAVAFSPDGSRCAWSSREGSWIWILDMETLELEAKSGYLNAHFFEALELEWSPTGERIWSAFECGGGWMNGFTIREGRLKKEYQGHGHVPRFGRKRGIWLNRDGITGLAPDGERLWARER